MWPVVSRCGQQPGQIGQLPSVREPAELPPACGAPEHRERGRGEIGAACGAPEHRERGRGEIGAACGAPGNRERGRGEEENRSN